MTKTKQTKQEPIIIDEGEGINFGDKDQCGIYQMGLIDGSKIEQNRIIEILLKYTDEDDDLIKEIRNKTQ